MPSHLISPHGARLVQLMAPLERRAALQSDSRDWPSVDLDNGIAEAKVDDIIDEGLHQFLSRFIHQNAMLAREVADGYLFGVQ